MAEAIDPDRLYTAQEVARIFGVHPDQPRRWADRSATGVRSPMIGRFPVENRRPLRVRGSALIAFREWRESGALRHPGVIVAAKSQNKKLGRAAATTVARQSCPESCLFRGEGCYAEHDNTRTHWDRISAGSAGVPPVELARREAAAIDELPADRDLRLHVAGDSPTEEGTRVLAAACGRYVERGESQGLAVAVWAYTHAWRDVPRDAWGVISVLASCETPAQAAEASARGYAASLVVEEFASDAAYRVCAPDGSSACRIVPCPQQTREKTCTDCRICFDAARLHKVGLAVGFALHGWGSNKARRSLRRVSLPVVAPLAKAA